MNLVTGGTSRIGQEIVKRLSGETLVHYYNNKELAESLSPFTIQADLTTTTGIKTFLKTIKRFDVVINNFGLVDDPKLDIDTWEALLRVNVMLPTLLTERADKLVINISSVSGLPKIPCKYGYGMSKAALNKLTDTYSGVRINAIAPAAVPEHVNAEEVAEAVLKIIDDRPLNNEIIYLWGTAPESQTRYIRWR